MKRMGYCKMWDYQAFLMSRAKGRMCCLDRKGKNIMFDDAFESVCIMLYMVYKTNVKHNI